MSTLHIVDFLMDKLKESGGVRTMFASHVERFGPGGRLPRVPCDTQLP